MERHQLLMEKNDQSNFFGDLEEVNTLRYISGYICTHIITSNESIKMSKTKLKTALLYMTTQISRLYLIEYDLIMYLSILFDEVIYDYQKTEDFMWCHNLFGLKQMFDKHYADFIKETIAKQAS